MSAPVRATMEFAQRNDNNVHMSTLMRQIDVVDKPMSISTPGEPPDEPRQRGDSRTNRYVIRPAPPYIFGRPSGYTAEIAAEIVERIELGQVLEEIAADEHMPSRRTINRWLTDHADFRQAYARARMTQAAGIAERGFMRAVNSTARTAQADRLAFDGCRWLASKLAPTTWSDRAEVNVTVADPEANARRAALRTELIASLQKLALAEPLAIDEDHGSQ
jgi:hypothetical protein